MPAHGILTNYDIHSPWTWIVADDTERLSLTFDDCPYDISKLIDKVCLQTNDLSMWTLTDPVLKSWSQLSAGSGGSVTYTNLNLTPNTVGGIPAGSSFNAKTMQEMWNALLYPELFPTLTNPSSTFTLTQSGYREIGEIITLNFSSSFNRGSISPAYGTSGFRSGLPNTYTYTGSGLPSSVSSSSLTNLQNVNNYTVLIGSQSWTQVISYDIGEQPLSSLGNPYNLPLAAGNASLKTVTITGVYPSFSTTSDITVMTKQALASMSSTYLQVTMVAESGSDKQTIDFPIAWSTITGIQFYNTFSLLWEWIGGSKANSLLTFTTSSVTHNVQGNTINYTRYTHNGSQIGSRQLRFYTT